MSLAQGFPNTFSETQQTQEVLKNLDNETKKIYTDINNLQAANGHAHTGNGSDGAKINAANIINTPAGNIAATDIQAAINELDSEKLSASGNAATATLAAKATKLETARTINGVSFDGTTNISLTATEEQAIAGTEDNALLTPAKLRSGLNASGSAPVYACRAWVSFNGTGTVAINASGNVTSITDNGTGDYTVNFTTPMSDANYCYVAAVGNSSNAYIYHVPSSPKTVSSLRLKACTNSSGTPTVIDATEVSVAIFR